MIDLTLEVTARRKAIQDRLLGNAVRNFLENNLKLDAEFLKGVLQVAIRTSEKSVTNESLNKELGLDKV